MIGALRQRLTLQSPVTTADNAGGVALSWQDAATLYAEITPLTGDEKIQAEKLARSVDYRVVVRAGVAVSETQRLVWHGMIFNIRAVLNVAARDRLLVLLCEEGGAT